MKNDSPLPHLFSPYFCPTEEITFNSFCNLFHIYSKSNISTQKVILLKFFSFLVTFN